MSSQNDRTSKLYAYVVAAIITAAVIVSASLIVAPALETTKTSTATSVVITPSPQITATNTVNFTSTIHSTITATMSAMPDSPCDTTVSGPGVPVLLMRPNSTGYICVTYRTQWLGNQTQFVLAQSRFNLPNPWHILPFPIGGLCSRVNGVTSCDQGLSHSFRTSVTPNYFNFSGSTYYFTVIDVVTALSNATGFYDYGSQGTGCENWPMAVGYSASQVNASDFVLSATPGCPAEAIFPVAEHVTGMNVTYVARPQP